ncbi:hypothetical protein DFH08DRAFT_756992, partial [Mycena albidolilacea]
MERARKARTLWRSAVDGIHEMLAKTSTSKEAAERAKQALMVLASLGWTGNLRGLKAGGNISDLVVWFNKKWLRTDHEDGMLEILADDLGLSDGDGDTIWSTYFVLALAQAYANPDKYRTAASFQWLRGLGQGFAMGTRRRLGTVANKDDEHWVALAIDSETKTVAYGDGFRKRVPKDLRRHIDWWLFEHLAIEFRWTDLPIPEQHDSHSCGVLAYSALANFFEPARFPLPESTAGLMADERVKAFLRIVERHNGKPNFTSESRGFEFTF